MVSNSQKRIRVKKDDFKHQLFIESYGVRIGVVSNTADGIVDAKKIITESLPNCFCETEDTKIEHHFRLVRNPSGKDSLYKNGEKVSVRVNREDLIEILGSQVRLTVAEFAVGFVFVHAGVISWKGKAIIFPGRSFSGKTTLTAALVKLGAVYYSDEYAILDQEGFVQPFPKTLSIRGEIDKNRQIEHSVESLGGIAGTDKIPIGMVLITEYKINARWTPQILSSGKGILEIIKNTVPIRNSPDFVLNVLTQMAKNAVIVKSSRGEVSKFAELALDFFEVECM